MRRVAIIGNGLSVSASAAFQMPALTHAVRARLQGLDAGTFLPRVEAVGDLLRTDWVVYQPQTNFEHLLGPLDRLSLLLRGPLLGIVGAGGQQQHVLRGAAIAVSGLYVRGVGAVLQTVDTIVQNVPSEQPIQDLVEWMVGGLSPADVLSVYTLNYDPLLNRWLLEANNDGMHPNVHLDDEFMPGNDLTLMLPGGPPNRLDLIALRPTSMPRPYNVHLYHLHGAMHWVEFNGAVCKPRDIDDLRDLRVFERWEAGHYVGVRPHLLLADQKTRAVTLEPFTHGYAALSADLQIADRIMVAGYSFGDEPLNHAIATGWQRRTSTARWLVVDRANPITGFPKRQRIRTMLGISPLLAGRFQFSGAGLPGVTTAEPGFWT